MDEQTEREIWNLIESLAHTRTLIIISHRLSTIRNADTIYLIHDGRVRESGSHEELMEANGRYARLVKEQNELEKNFSGRRSS